MQHEPTDQPATPGSYGEPPPGQRLPAETRPGTVRLAVADLERSLTFYTEVLGLAPVSHEGGTAALGAPGSARPLVELEEQTGARPAGRPPRLGLFHFALLLPDRAALGRLVRHLLGAGVRPGAGDHLVSEAFYLSDPDGLGIEVYADRPRSDWRRAGRELRMGTEPVDVEGVLRAAGDTRCTGIPAGTTLGHVHLHVADLARASDFYHRGLGFDRVVWSYPGALFLGAGGYHHHLGLNTWAGPAAGPPGPGDARLLEWTLELPGPAALAAAARGLADAGYAMTRPSDGEVLAADPWGTAVRLTGNE